MDDPTRSRILVALLDGPGRPGQLAEQLGLTRTNVSNHLACLRGCGLVVAQPQGRSTLYRIADPHLAAALEALAVVGHQVQAQLPCSDAGCSVPGCCADCVDES